MRIVVGLGLWGVVLAASACSGGQSGTDQQDLDEHPSDDSAAGDDVDGQDPDDDDATVDDDTTDDVATDDDIRADDDVAADDDTADDTNDDDAADDDVTDDDVALDDDGTDDDAPDDDAGEGGEGSGGAPSSGGGGAGGTPSSGPAPQQDACAGYPLSCVALCEAGDCQCDCSGSGLGCDTPGWASTTLAWEQFGLSDAVGTGVTFCHPESWLWQDPPTVNQPTLEGSLRITLMAFDQLDHESALAYVSNQDAGACDYEPYDRYGVTFLRVGEWAGLEQSYITEAPVCGECPGPLEPMRLIYGSVVVAAGTHVIDLRTNVPEADASSLREFHDVAATVVVDNGQTPGEVSADLGVLSQNHRERCPQ